MKENNFTSTQETLMHSSHCRVKCISWSAVIVGALVAVGLSFLLNLFTLAIGLSAFTTSPEGNTTLAVGGFVGLVIGTIVVMFVAGLVAGYLGRPYSLRRNYGELYGFTAWCLALILTVLLTAHIGTFVSHTIDAINPHTTATMSASNDTTTITNKVNRPDSKVGVTQTTVSTEKAVNNLGMITFSTFFLFFIGALASCFGGRCGMTCHRGNKEEVA